MTWAHLVLSLSLPITVRTEENTTCASESFSHLSSVLKSLTNLRLLVMTSLAPT